MSEPLQIPSAWRGRITILILLSLVLAFWLVMFAYHQASRESFKIYLAELAAKGESLAIDHLRPNPVTQPDENVAEAPIFAEYLARRRADPEAMSEADPVWRKLDMKAVPGFSMNRISHLRTDVQYLRSRPLWEGFETEDDLIAARAVLEYAESQELHLAEIREALLRPEANFGIAYENLFSISFNELNGFHAVSKLLHRQGRAALLTGRTDLAKTNSLALLRFSRHVGSQTTLLHVLVSVGIHNLAISLIRDGLIAGAWREDDLTDLAGELEISWLEPCFLGALRMERAMGSKLWKDTAEGGDALQSLLPDSRVRALFLIPDLRKGWCYDNLEFHCRTIQETMLEDGKGMRLTNHINARPLLSPDPAVTGSVPEEFRAVIKTLRHGISRSSSTSFIGINQRVLRARVYHDHARLGVALAMFHAQHDRYPGTLESLFLPGDPAMPLDPFTDAPFVYKPIEDSDYLLYCVGPDGRDDGGLIRHRQELGDWVWRLRLPEDFDYDAYRVQR